MCIKCTYPINIDVEKLLIGYKTNFKRSFFHFWLKS